MRDALSGPLNPDEVAAAIEATRRHPKVAAMAAHLRLLRAARAPKRGGKGAGRGRGRGRGGGAGAGGRGEGGAGGGEGPRQPKGVHSAYQAFLQIAIAHLKAGGHADLANKKAVADVWGKMPATAREPVERRLNALK